MVDGAISWKYNFVRSKSLMVVPQSFERHFVKINESALNDLSTEPCVADIAKTTSTIF